MSWLNPIQKLRLTWVLPLFILLLLVGLIWAVKYTIDQDRALTLETHRSVKQSLVRALDEHVDSVIREVDQTVRFLKYRAERSPNDLDINALLGNEIIINRYFTQLGIVDERGFLAMTNKLPLKRVDLRDREHVRVHQENPKQGLFISKPVLGRASGKWSIQFTRRIDKPAGAFGGVVVVSVDPFYFTDLYRDVDLGETGGILLVGLDGVVRATHHTAGLTLGDKVSDTAWFKALRPNVILHQEFVDPDGKRWMVTARMLDGYPLAIVLIEEWSEVLASHDVRRERLVFTAGLAAMLLLLSGAFIIRLAYRLQLSQREAESANRMKSEFLAHMSHELRTPLNGVLGAAELIAEGEELEECREMARLIQRSGQQLQTQVDMVLDLARLEAGRLTLHRKHQPLGALMAQACDLHTMFSVQKSLPLLRMWDEHELGSALVDGDRLVEVVSNLVHNALKYTEKGEVTVDAQRVDEHLIITVWDSGVGIAEQDQQLIFDKFRQVERFVTRQHGGSGLGLALVRELVELMQGQIQVHSIVGEGSRFKVIIPLTERG